MKLILLTMLMLFINCFPAEHNHITLKYYVIMLIQQLS